MADENKLDQILWALWNISSKIDTLDERITAVEQWSHEPVEPWNPRARTPQEEEMAKYEKKIKYRITQSMSGGSKKPGKMSFYEKNSSWEAKKVDWWLLKDMMITDIVFNTEKEAIDRLNKKDPNWRTNNTYGFSTVALYTS
jgi:hypothetical protein